MKLLNASFLDLNGNIVKIDTLYTLNKQIEIAEYMVILNNEDNPVLNIKLVEHIRNYWQDRLDSLLAIKRENGKTLYQHWQAGDIGNFGSFQTCLFNAYQRADSINTAKLNASFPEWFVNPYQL